MVGRFEGTSYTAGLATYPSLFAPVCPALPDEIDAIFRAGDGPKIRLGEAVVAPDQDVWLDANRLLARHCAVVGSTGAGKSCTVTALVDGILALRTSNANVVILDTNGEYAAAFDKSTDRGTRANVFVVGPETGDGGGLAIPHWLMDNEDHLALLQAREGVQAPLLQRAVADARLQASAATAKARRVFAVARGVDDIRNLGSPDMRANDSYRLGFQGVVDYANTCRGLASAEGDAVSEAAWRAISDAVTIRNFNWAGAAAPWQTPLTPQQHQAIGDALTEIGTAVEALANEAGVNPDAKANFDSPTYYSMTELHDTFLPRRIESESRNDPRMRNYAAPMLLRLGRLLADKRYDFITRVPKFATALTRFLRLVFGRSPVRGTVDDDLPWSKAYRQRAGKDGRHAVTIFDLSLISSDVLENVTALIGRLVFSFAQRAIPRGSFPVLLVLEEAHRYVPGNTAVPQPRSAAVFERIAKEGRKFGVSLLVASQRPSELSKTLVAQCGTLIAHRIVNPEDQELIRHATPFAGRDVLRQLPGLANQHAVVLGEAVAAPSYVRVRNIQNPPLSKDPDFIASWQAERIVESDAAFDQFASNWEKEAEG